MTDMINHATERPFRVVGNLVVDADNKIVATFGSDLEERDYAADCAMADLFTRTVNAHERLVKALEEIAALPKCATPFAPRGSYDCGFSNAANAAAKIAHAALSIKD